MAEALRNLQIFRNSTLLTGSITTVKGLIETAIGNGNLTVKDGEPISIRYKESEESTEVKGLYGVVYGNGTTAIVLWNDAAISIDTTPKDNAYVTLNHTEDENGNVQLTVAYTTAKVSEAGTITGYKNNTTGEVITVAEYEALSEELKANYTAVEKDGLTTAQDVKDYVDNKYIGSKAIEVVDNTDDKNVISIKVSDHEGNIINIDDNGIWAVQGASTTITDIRVLANDTTETVYYTLDESNKIAPGDASSNPVVAIAAGTREIVLATSDKKMTHNLMPATTDKFVESGLLKDVAATETEDAKKVIEFTYNLGGTFQVDVTELVNTAHTKVTGETAIEGGNEDYVSVTSTPSTDKTEYTLKSSVKTQAVSTATATDNGLATAKDVKDYVDGIAHTSVSAGDDTITVTESTVDGHKNYAVKAAQAVVTKSETTAETNPDTLSVDTEGVLNQTAMTVIENYIDNYDCGTFTL